MERERVFVHHVDDVPWDQAPLPRRWHFCRVQTWGIDGTTPIARCACGAARIGLAGHWQRKNERRKEQRHA